MKKIFIFVVMDACLKIKNLTIVFNLIEQICTIYIINKFKKDSATIFK